MPARRARLPLALIGCSWLAACASDGDYPSLAARPEELSGPCAVETETVEAAPSPAPPADDATLAARLAQLVEQANQGQKAFEAELGQVSSKVERAGPAGSESWIEAQQAVSSLEAARGPTAMVLAELDGIAKERSTVPTTDADAAALAAAIAEVSALSDRQREEINRLATAHPTD